MRNSAIKQPCSPGLDCPQHLYCLMSVASMNQLPPDALEHVANYFRTLSESTRLRILNVLDTGEMSVGEIAQEVQSSVANVSRHLALLSSLGLVARESRGTSVYYRIADASVYQLCDLVCGSLARQMERSAQERALFADAAPAPRRARSRSRAAGAA